MPFVVLYFVKVYGASDQQRSLRNDAAALLNSATLNQGDVARVLEFRYATDQLRAAPIFGKGLAYRVPSELIFNGQQAELSKIEEEHGKKYPFVFYTHNSFAYL